VRTVNLTAVDQANPANTARTGTYRIQFDTSPTYSPQAPVRVRYSLYVYRPLR
jgi:hypothetical protein